jgi:hypothetical protein
MSKKKTMYMQEQDTRGVNEAMDDSSVIRILLEQRRKFVAEINRIDRMLAREGIRLENLAFQAEPTAVTLSGRPRNSISKVDALLTLLKTAKKPLSQKDLVVGIQNLGYVFASRNPTNTMTPLLYGDKKLSAVKKLPGGFILADREQEFLSQASTPQ